MPRINLFVAARFCFLSRALACLSVLPSPPMFFMTVGYSVLPCIHAGKIAAGIAAALQTSHQHALSAALTPVLDREQIAASTRIGTCRTLGAVLQVVLSRNLA
jgi:hypothetical protein